MKKKLLNLVEIQQTYIDFLHAEISKYATTSKYEISNRDFRYGQELRDSIEEVKESLEK